MRYQVYSSKPDGPSKGSFHANAVRMTIEGALSLEETSGGKRKTIAIFSPGHWGGVVAEETEGFELFGINDVIKVRADHIYLNEDGSVSFVTQSCVQAWFPPGHWSSVVSIPEKPFVGQR